MVKLNEELAEESFQIIGIFADHINNLARGLKEKEYAGLETTCLMVSESLAPAIERIQYIPYLYFVDSEGEIIKVDRTGKLSLEQLVEAVEEAFEYLANENKDE